MKHDSEEYLNLFYDFIMESKKEKEETEKENKKYKNKESNKEKINKEPNNPVFGPDKLIADRLTPEEKKKKASDEKSSQRKRSWGASHQVSPVPDGYKELKSLSKGVAEAKKEKPDCRPGGKWHDSKGRFSSKEKATSWSGGYEDSNRTDCKAGKFKTSGDGKKKITRHKCGKAPDGSKEKFKCKSGEPYWKVNEDRLNSDRELSSFASSELVDELLKRLEENMSTAEILRLCSAINQSAKGDYPPK